MAKKKLSHSSQSQDPKQSQMEAQTMSVVNLTDNSSSHKIENLKNLNAVLLKETTQCRHQIQYLQSELHRSAVTYDDNLAAFHIENAVTSLFVDCQVQEMNLCFHTLLGEKDGEVDALKCQLSGLALRLQKETTALAKERDSLAYKRKLFEESADREGKLREEMEKIRSDSEEMLSQQQIDIEELKMERDSALKSSRESLAAVEILKEKIEAVTREKNEYVKVSQNQEQKIGRLEEELTVVNESWKKQEQCMRVQFIHVDERLGVATQKMEEMAKEISTLLAEKKEIEKSVAMLNEDIAGARKSLNVIRNELEDKQREVDEAVRVKGEIEEVKVNLEGEIVELREKISELMESYQKFEEENKELLSQVKSYRIAVEDEIVEKENMKKVFYEEKKKVEKLELLIAKSQEEVVKRDADLVKVRSERERLVENEKKMEGHVGDLRNENEALKSKLLEARKEVKELSAKVEVWCNNSNRALTLLKNAAALVSQQKERGEEVVSNVEEMEVGVEEVEKIKKAFKSKEEMLDEMKQKVVSLNKSVAEAHKSKNIWTVISSATTIFAAALAAYVARGR
ncbi:unnamed protein product [Sphenostylis stenocarpa]|uniref:Uncharacterized protein n=1 Tax=Sphenostylis stenocarpa TaxID=92480 RepID=A0AA86TKD5_9FABA|nr:unnamed protein product [Sphenostylis stenocarpa]